MRAPSDPSTIQGRHSGGKANHGFELPLSKSSIDKSCPESVSCSGAVHHRHVEGALGKNTLVRIEDEAAVRALCDHSGSDASLYKTRAHFFGPAHSMTS